MAKAVVNLGTEETILTLSKEELNELKDLLLKDLSARLPYGVMLSTPSGNKPLLALVSSKKYNTIIVYVDYCGNENNINEWQGGDVEFIKPYLRPMSSMTEEEYNELKAIAEYYGFAPFEYIYDWCPNYEATDWLNKHHFDYRGLIEKGLALEAT